MANSPRIRLAFLLVGGLLCLIALIMRIVHATAMPNIPAGRNADYSPLSYGQVGLLGLAFLLVHRYLTCRSRTGRDSDR